MDYTHNQAVVDAVDAALARVRIAAQEQGSAILSKDQARIKRARMAYGEALAAYNQCYGEYVENLRFNDWLRRRG